MSWQEHHRMSEVYASHAEIAERRGDGHRARELYTVAAQSEESALAELGDDKPRTYGITAVSAVALRYKAGQLSEAQTLAYRSLGSGRLPKFAWRQLESLTDSIRIAQAGIIEDDAQMIVSVKGGDILPGAAPLDLILKHEQAIKSLIYRTAEHMHDFPYRRHGPPRKKIRDSYSPWMIQVEPGSYQYSVAVRTTKPPVKPIVGNGGYFVPHTPADVRSASDLFIVDNASPAMLVHHLTGILAVATESPIGGLSDIAPDPEYRRTFLRLIHSLSPDGIQFTQLEIRATNPGNPIILTPDTRWAIKEAIDACQIRDRH